MTGARLVLALETSARPPSLALERGDRTFTARLGTERRHASDLLPALAQLLGEVGATARDLDAIVVGTGPGSYTGLRVGVATALGLARATGADLVGVPSVAALAFERLAPAETGTVLLDARSRQLYLAVYRRTESALEEVVAPRVTTADELGRHLPGTGPILGDATVADAARLDDAAVARLSTDAVPTATGLLRLGVERLERAGPTPPEGLRPLYLRPFAAAPRRR